MCDVAVYTEKIDWGERSSPEADWFVEQRFVQQISTAFQCQKGTGKNYISSLWYEFYGHTFHVFLCCLYLVCQKFGSSKSFGGTVRWKPTLAKHCGDYEEH